MIFIIYGVLPCLGSMFILGAMFYGAYRIAEAGQRGGRETKVETERQNPPKAGAEAGGINLRETKGRELQKAGTEAERYKLREAETRKHGVWETEADQHKLQKAETTRWGIAVAYVMVSVLLSMLGSTWVNLTIMLLFPFVAGWVMETSRTFLVPYYILAVAVFMTDTVVVMGYQILWIKGILYLNSPELAYILLIISSRMSEFMVILLVAIIAGKRAGKHITVRQVVLSVFLPIFSIFNMYYTLYMMQFYQTEETVMLFIINMVLLIGLNIYFCVLIDIMGENRRLANERNLYRQQAMMQYQYYEREEEKFEESRKIIHDIRNHIQAMEALYSSAGTKEASQYAGNIHKMLNRFQQKYYTSERLLNIILNDKAACMQRAGIREDMKVGELSLDFMRDTDVTTLFGNLLDNAVAAAAESRDGYIRLRVNMVRQFISIVMENSCDRKPVKEGEGFRSKKSGHCGLGIVNIRRTVEQYGGDVQFEWREGVFVTKVVLVCAAGENDRAENNL